MYINYTVNIFKENNNEKRERPHPSLASQLRVENDRQR
jgi:hypothetical protein